MMRRLDLVDLRKPVAVCHAAQTPTHPLDGAARCEQRLAGLGLGVRRAEPADHGPLTDLMTRRLAPASRRSIAPYDLYRVLQFGDTVVLEDGAGRVQGFFLEQRYGDPARTSYCVSLAVAEHLVGQGIGAELIRYCGLVAAAAGCRMQRAVLSPRNLASCVTFFNRIGHIAEDFYRELEGYGESRFAICCPLVGAGLLANRLDLAAAERLVETGTAGRDYAVAEPADDLALERLYRSSPFRVIGVLPGTAPGRTSRLLAVAEERLELVRT